jgi:hypothetical protein
MSDRRPADEMPTLDAFDEEFGPQQATTPLAPARRMRLRFWIFICLVLGAGVISALALGWPHSDGWLPLGVPSASILPAAENRDGASAQVERLRREVAVLKNEIKDLTAAQQRAADTIAALRRAAMDSQNRAFGHWYSDLAALSFGIATQSDQSVAEPAPRRPATVRARSNEFRRRDNGTPRDTGAAQRDTGAPPLSLEPQQ